MSLWLNILIDIAILVFVGLLYYFYQKRRIIKVSREVILSELEEYRLQLNEYAEMKKNHPDFKLINEFCVRVDKYSHNQNFQALMDDDFNEHILTPELVENFKIISEKIADYLKSH